MRKLVVLTFLTLDGVMQAPGGPDEDTENGFKYGGWSAGYWDNFMNEVMERQMGMPFEMLLGRKTYEIFAGYWPNSKEKEAYVMNNTKKYVASLSLKSLDWENSQLISGDIAAGIKKLKEKDGPVLQVYGSSDLIQTLLKHDLVDEFWLKIFPVTLGSGKRLFGSGTIPASYRVTESSTSPQGVIVARYIRDGSVRTGSF